MAGTKAFEDGSFGVADTSVAVGNLTFTGDDGMGASAEGATDRGALLDFETASSVSFADLTGVITFVDILLGVLFSPFDPSFFAASSGGKD